MTDEREQPRSVNNSAFNNSTRLGQWFALAFFSSIALVALCTRYDKDFADERAVVKWALSVICIAVGMASLAVCATIAMPDKFNGTKLEGGMVCINVFEYDPNIRCTWGVLMP